MIMWTDHPELMPHLPPLGRPVVHRVLPPLHDWPHRVAFDRLRRGGCREDAAMRNADIPCLPTVLALTTTVHVQRRREG
jgi:hypothetical protein